MMRRDFSVASKLLKHPGMQDATGRDTTKFSLRVLADERLNPSIIVNERLLTPGFSAGGSASEEMAQLKDALVWITEIYPKDLPEEYLLIATMGRWGWVSSQGDEATRTAQFREDLLAALPPHFRDIVETGLILGARSPTREETTKRSPFFSIGWNTPRIDRRQPTKNVFCIYVTTRRPGANKG